MMNCQNEPYYVNDVIIATKENLHDLTSLMEFILDDWRYENLKDVMDMQSRLVTRYNTVHESFHPVLDMTWKHLRRLTNLYNLYR